MRTIARLHVAPEAGDAPGAEERRLELLRHIADAGGTVAPSADPQAELGYVYSALPDAIDSDLEFLAERNYLEARFFDRVSLCPKCGSHHLNVREICPGCRRAHLTSEGLFHHFRCGNVGLPPEFTPTGDGGFVCPKCHRTMRHLGTEYDRLGKAFACHSCGMVSDNPPVEAVCLACATRTAADDLVSADIFSYVLTSRGAAAIRRRTLIDGGDDSITAPEAPVYRRALTLEFLDHEVKRLKLFNARLSVLVIEHVLSADEQPDEVAAPWLARMRSSLRDMDIVGQLADALYLVILPQTRRRAADALRQRIEAELGSQSPLRIAAVPITGPDDVTAILARRAAPGAKP